MFTIHQLIAQHGLDGARRLAATKAERSCIDAAAAVLSEPLDRADVGYAVLASSCLPHKSLDRSAVPQHWEGRIDNVSIAMDSGCYGDGSLIGIPYGSKARIILVYLTTAAVLSSSPQIELGASMYAWLRGMSAGKFGGMTYRLFAEQARRIAAMTIRTTVKTDGDSLVLSGHSITELVQASADPGAQPLYWQPSTPSDFPHSVVLDQHYWRSAKVHSAAIRLCALRELGNNGAAIDLYVWLAHRLAALEHAETVDWHQLHVMFGSGYKNLRQMKQPLLNALQLALAVYPEAQVGVDTTGLRLMPGAAPVPSALRAPVPHNTPASPPL